MSDLKNELITAYEDILTCKYVESWSDLGECHSITTEGAIKIAKRLLELDSNNVIANDTLDIEEGLLLIQYTIMNML
jgi:SUMO ligase MMS21 Smc5/6 complex component